MNFVPLLTEGEANAERTSVPSPSEFSQCSDSTQAIRKRFSFRRTIFTYREIRLGYSYGYVISTVITRMYVCVYFFFFFFLLRVVPSLVHLDFTYIIKLYYYTIILYYTFAKIINTSHCYNNNNN